MSLSKINYDRVMQRMVKFGKKWERPTILMRLFSIPVAPHSRVFDKYADVTIYLLIPISSKDRIS